MCFLYVVYTAHTNGKNMKIDCKSMKITVNDTNTYSAVRSKDQIRYMKNYYNGAYLKEVNIGDSVKFVETFEIPTAELEAGRTIRISKSLIPDSDKIRLSTDQIVFCDSPEEIASFGDDRRYHEILRGHKKGRHEDFETVVFRKDGRAFTAAICRGTEQAEKALSEIDSFDVIGILGM